MKTLDQIAIEHGTDKASKHPLISGHNYAIHYDAIFSPIRHEAVRLLEIGVGGGESIRTWLEYFDNPDARIFGVDIVQCTNPWNTPSEKPDPRYTFSHGDQSDSVMWKCFIANCGGNLDVVIDDGSHTNKDIIISYKALWPNVVNGGLYCIEDLMVGYGDSSVFVHKPWQRHMDFIKDFLDDINLNENVKELHFSKELAILRKP